MINFKSLTLSLLCLSLLISCQSGGTKMSQEVEAQIVKQKVDIQRFMGDWFVIASIPTPFETGVYNGLERYKWNQEDERIEISFLYNHKSFEGKVKEITQKGWVQESGQGAYWKVQPFWPLKFGYLILAVSENYDWTVIGVPDKSYAWIMAREHEMSSESFAEARKRLEELGYAMKKLKRVPQNGKKPVK